MKLLLLFNTVPSCNLIDIFKGTITDTSIDSLSESSFLLSFPESGFVVSEGFVVSSGLVTSSFLVVSSFPSSVFPFSVSRFPTTFSTSEGNPLVALYETTAPPEISNVSVINCP